MPGNAGGSKGPLGRWTTHPPWRCIIESCLPTRSGNIAVITRGTKGECKPADMQRMSGADLS